MQPLTPRDIKLIKQQQKLLEKLNKKIQREQEQRRRQEEKKMKRLEEEVRKREGKKRGKKGKQVFCVCIEVSMFIKHLLKHFITMLEHTTHLTLANILRGQHPIYFAVLGYFLYHSTLSFKFEGIWTSQISLAMQCFCSKPYFQNYFPYLDIPNEDHSQLIHCILI